MLCRGSVIIISLVTQIVSPVADEKTVPPEVTEFRPVQDLERKIVSKSIFIAPIFQKCPDGYLLDLHGQCYRLIRVDEQTHWNNLVARLNKFYQKFEHTSSIPTPVTLPQPFEYQVVNVVDHGVSNQLERTENEPMQFQLPIPTSRVQKSDEPFRNEMITLK